MFVYNPGQADKAKIAKRKFEVCMSNFACTFSSTTTTQVEEGDLLTLLNVYYAFHNRGGSDWSKSKHWCAAHFLRYKALKRFEFLFFCVCFLFVCFLFFLHNIKQLKYFVQGHRSQGAAV